MKVQKSTFPVVMAFVSLFLCIGMMVLSFTQDVEVVKDKIIWYWTSTFVLMEVSLFFICSIFGDFLKRYRRKMILDKDNDTPKRKKETIWQEETERPFEYGYITSVLFIVLGFVLFTIGSNLPDQQNLMITGKYIGLPFLCSGGCTFLFAFFHNKGWIAGQILEVASIFIILFIKLLLYIIS
jgi:hypothetical protein